jgi:hypothetical protein
MQKAFDVTVALNLEYDVTIEVGTGSFIGAWVKGPVSGAGTIIVHSGGSGTTTYTYDSVNNTGDTFLFDGQMRVRFTGAFTLGASAGTFKTYFEADFGCALTFSSATITITGDATDTFYSGIGASTATFSSGTITVGSTGLGKFVLLNSARLVWSSTALTFTSTPSVDAFGEGAVDLNGCSDAAFFFGTITGSSTGIKWAVSGSSFLNFSNKTMATWPLGSTLGICDQSSLVSDSGTKRFNSGTTIDWDNASGTAIDLTVRRSAANTLALGKVDAAAPVAQTISVQNVVTGTTDVAGAAWTFSGSQGTGTGAGGSIIFKTAPAGSTGSSQNALTTGLTLSTTALTLAAEYKLATTLSATKTIATGVITITGSYHRIETEAAAATDDLDTINGGVDGMRLVIRPLDAAHTVVVKDATGNIQCAGDFTMDNAQDTMELIFDSALSAWLEIGRSDNGA